MYLENNRPEHITFFFGGGIIQTVHMKSKTFIPLIILPLLILCIVGAIAARFGDDDMMGASWGESTTSI